MSELCPECQQTTVWDPDLGSAICTTCGTLVDPSQTNLASHLEHVNTSTSTHDHPQYWNQPSRATRILKGRNGWSLPGQEKEATLRRNMIQIHDFIRTVTSQLSCFGLTSRAQNIFDLAMQKGRYRWGRRAKLVAGASIVVALREARKCDSIHEIAHLLDEPPLAIGRAFTTIVRLLQLPPISADPCFHLSTLHTQLLAVIQPSCPGTLLPSDLLTPLKSLAPHLLSVLNTATSLSLLVGRLDKFSSLPTGPTACAILMLSLEAELATSLPNISSLAQVLGNRLSSSKRVVMQRYKLIYDLIEEWIKEVPWLEVHQSREGGQQRSKVAKRVLVARGLKDVVQFQEQILRKRVEGIPRTSSFLRCGEECSTEIDVSEEEQTSGCGGGASDVTSSRGIIGTRSPQQARQTTYQGAVWDASRFALDPLSSPTTPKWKYAGSGNRSSQDILGHLLTVDEESFENVFTHAPSRLQRLVAERGGAENAIGDDELFENSELESLFRTPEEILILQKTLAWEDNDIQAVSAPAKKRKRDLEDVCGETNRLSDLVSRKRTSRIDMDALAKVLDPSVVLDGNEDDALSLVYPTEEIEGEVIGDWRPASPEEGSPHDDDFYDL